MTALGARSTARSTNADAAHDIGVARENAIQLLARREHSVDELRRKLKRRGYAASTIDAVVTSLRDSEFVSDVRFAQSFVRVRSDRGQGPLRIRAELRDRGVTDVLADEVLTVASEFWLERARKARAKRFGEAMPATREDWNRQARFLAQRGFPGDLIRLSLSNAHC